MPALPARYSKYKPASPPTVSPSGSRVSRRNFSPGNSVESDHTRTVRVSVVFPTNWFVSRVRTMVLVGSAICGASPVGTC